MSSKSAPGFGELGHELVLVDPWAQSTIKAAGSRVGCLGTLKMRTNATAKCYKQKNRREATISGIH